MVAYKLTAMEAERFQNIKPIEFILNLWNTNDESQYIQHEMNHLKEMVDASNHVSFNNNSFYFLFLNINIFLLFIYFNFFFYFLLIYFIIKNKSVKLLGYYRNFNTTFIKTKS